MRRMAASFSMILAADNEARAAIESIRFLAVGPRKFRNLGVTHGRLDVALALVIGEYTRLDAWWVLRRAA